MTSLKDNTAFELSIGIGFRKFGIRLNADIKDAANMGSFTYRDGSMGNIAPLSNRRIIPTALSDKLVPFFIEGSFGLGIRGTLLSVDWPGYTGTTKEDR